MYIILHDHYNFSDPQATYLIPGKDYKVALKYHRYKIILINPPSDLDLIPFYGLYFSDLHFTSHNISCAKELIFEGCYNISSLYLPNCQRLTCRRCNKLTAIHGDQLKFLKVQDCPVMERISAKKLERTKISNCSNLENFDFLFGIERVSLKSVSFKDCRLLGESKIVKCVDCQDLVEVWALSEAEKLSLINCHFIRDISSLDRVKYLNISGSYRITNSIPYPHRLETFIAVRCHGITDVRNLRGCKEVNLSFCNFLTDLSGLERCTKVTLDYCDSIQSLDKLSLVPEISLQYCPNTLNVSVLRNCQKLNLSYCDRIIGLSFVRKIPRLIIEDYILYQN